MHTMHCRRMAADLLDQPDASIDSRRCVRADKAGVEVPHVLAVQLWRQMPSTAHGAGVTALAAHYHAKLSGTSTPSACAYSPGQRQSAVHDTDLPEDVCCPLPLEFTSLFCQQGNGSSTRFLWSSPGVSRHSCPREAGIVCLQWPKVTCALQPALAYLAAACTAAGSGDRVSTLQHLLSLQRLAALEASTHAAVAMLSHMRAVATSAASVAAMRAPAPAPLALRPQLATDAASEHSDGRSSGLELRFPLEAAMLQGAVGAATAAASEDWFGSTHAGGAAAAVGAISDVSIDCEIMDSDAIDTTPPLTTGASLDVLSTAARAADTVLAAVASAVDESLPTTCGIGVAVRVSLNVRRTSSGRGDSARNAGGTSECVEVVLAPRTMMTAPEVVLSTSAAAWAAAPTVPAVDAPAFASGRSCPSECARGVRDLLCAAVQPESEGSWQGAALKVRLECVSPLSVSSLTAASIMAHDGALSRLTRHLVIEQPAVCMLLIQACSCAVSCHPVVPV